MPGGCTPAPHQVVSVTVPELSPIGGPMVAIFAWWGGSAFVITVLALIVGFVATRRILGLLIDSRGRYSLTHLQVSLWTIVILSLIAGLFFGRWQHHVNNPLGFQIPSVVLGLLGISVGTAVTATAAKATKNTTRAANVAASAPDPSWNPSLMQIFLQEEGTYADQVVDITKFQKFIITIVLVTAYVGLAIHKIMIAHQASHVKGLPGFSGTFLVLLGISYAGYLAGKLPSPGGTPTGLSVAGRDVVVKAAGQPRGLRPGKLWQQSKPGISLNVWQASLAQASRDETLVITGSRPFVLHWTTDDWNHAHDTGATPFANGSQAVALGPSDLAGANRLQFKRQYQGGEWETSDNHSVELTG